MCLPFRFSEYFGLLKSPFESNPDLFTLYGRLTLAATRGDGALSDEQRRWLIGSMVVKGCPVELINQLSDPAYKEEDLEGVIATFSAHPFLLRYAGRSVIDSAICVVSADGYTPASTCNCQDGKRAWSYRRRPCPDCECAGQLRFNQFTVCVLSTIEQEALVREEAAIQRRRITKLVPSHPLLDPKFAML